MKKLLNTSLVWMILGLAMGVFYREFTKWSVFAGVTALGKVHTHLLVLGMLFFLVVALFGKVFPGLEKNRLFGWFYWVYNVGLAGSAVLMTIRGIAEVKMVLLTAAQSAMISGMAGLFHITLAAGLVLFFLCLKKECNA